MHAPPDTICAVATPPGRGGIGIIRVSGPLAAALCGRITGSDARVGAAQRTVFHDAAGEAIDFGLSLFFAAPRSFTGEDVWELHAHGSPVVLDRLQAELVRGGCRLARPGEFSERAFLNGKIDLAQAEAIADLIASASSTAARMALRSLQGEFSRLVSALVAELTSLRVYVEAAIDFPDEEVDFLSGGELGTRLTALQTRLQQVQEQARQGARMREGLNVVLAGAPNAGKSTLLNALAGMDAAIVSDIPGTTRDILRQEITLGGMPLHLADTAGLRPSTDPVEQEGMRRARAALANADRILLLLDAQHHAPLERNPLWMEFSADDALRNKLTLVLNKIDLVADLPPLAQHPGVPILPLSAKLGTGLDTLKDHLLAVAGLTQNDEGGFSARRRHLDALRRAAEALARAQEQLQHYKAGELVAEELRLAQDALGEITGTVSADTLLGAIFSSFCIGK